MSTPLDMDRIAKDLGAERRGKVVSRGGYFGAVQLAAEVAARFRVPDGGDARPTSRGMNSVWSAFQRRHWDSLNSSPRRRTRARCRSPRYCWSRPCRQPLAKSNASDVDEPPLGTRRACVGRGGHLIRNVRRVKTWPPAMRSALARILSNIFIGTIERTRQCRVDEPDT